MLICIDLNTDKFNKYIGEMIMGDAENIMNGAMNMVAVGTGIGLMTAAAMIPLKVTEKMMSEGVSSVPKPKHPNKVTKGVKVSIPKIDIKVKTPKIKGDALIKKSKKRK